MVELWLEVMQFGCTAFKSTFQSRVGLCTKSVQPWGSLYQLHRTTV